MHREFYTRSSSLSLSVTRRRERERKRGVIKREEEREGQRDRASGLRLHLDSRFNDCLRLFDCRSLRRLPANSTSGKSRAQEQQDGTPAPDPLLLRVCV